MVKGRRRKLACYDVSLQREHFFFLCFKKKVNNDLIRDDRGDIFYFICMATVKI